MVQQNSYKEENYVIYNKNIPWHNTNKKIIATFFIKTKHTHKQWYNLKKTIITLSPTIAHTAVQHNRHIEQNHVVSNKQTKL